MEAEKKLTPRGAALIGECTGVARRWHNHNLPGVGGDCAAQPDQVLQQRDPR